MTARVEGGVWIGLRNPIPDGLALLVALLNPQEVVTGAAPRFGDPVRLDLDGLGVRAPSWWRHRYLILAGAYDHGGSPRLYTWDGVGAPQPVSGLDLADFNPEGFFSPEERDELLLLSDDGTRLVDEKECKKLKDPGRRRFRGVWISLPPVP
jgi:hypothetical protein